MNQKTISKLPQRSLVYLLICVVGILGFVFAVIYPHQKVLADLDQEMRSIHTRVAEQGILTPLFQDLTKKMRCKDPEVLPFPRKAKLERDNLHRLPSIFREVAQESNLRLEDFKPDFDSLVDDSRLLTVNLFTKGDFFDLRRFLIQLGEIPFVESIEQIKIGTVQGSKELQFILKIGLGQE